ncbi:MAG: ABC transporter ATP-binding protein [Chloroflexi bacterium]|nr:ABC transporter ATP-binding protein [Chloroflexota bacterium]
MNVVLRVVRYMKPFWKLETIAYLCMLAINGARLISPRLIQRIIDVGIGQNQVDVLATSVLLLLGLTVLQGIFGFGQTYLTENVSQGVAFNMRNELYRKLQSLSFSYHDHAEGGQLLARATSDVERLQRITGRGVLGLIDGVILLIGTTIMLFRMNPLLASLSLLVMPIIILIMRFYLVKVHPIWRLRQDQTAQMTSRVEQNLRGVTVVRGFAQEHAEIARFDEVNNSIYATSMRAARASAFTMPFIVFLAMISTVVILWLGGNLVVSHTLTIGALIAFNSYVLQLVNPVRRIGMLLTVLGESRASAERVFEILDAKSEVENMPNAMPLGDIQGEVTFDKVSFSYLGGKKVLDEISFTANPGQVVALLGPTGSGKSTIINLIPRFYDVSSGSIRIDGQDIRDVTIDSLRNQIGIVLQETRLFGSTIGENISFGRPEATQEEIEAAARAAAAHEFIEAMPDGYKTGVGERGETLSGGQRQRIAIARALLMDPRILLLDDATSSVDTDTEQQIQAALQRLMVGRTSFVIAQRVSTVRQADLILVIDSGRIVASGKHAELIQQSGVYADIYYRQLQPDRAAVPSEVTP